MLSRNSRKSVSDFQQSSGLLNFRTDVFEHWTYYIVLHYNVAY